MGGQVPKSYYLSSNKPVPKDDMEVATVSMGTKKKLEFNVDVVNSVLRWKLVRQILSGDLNRLINGPLFWQTGGNS